MNHSAARSGVSTVSAPLGAADYINAACCGEFDPERLKFSYYQGNCYATIGLQSDFGLTGVAGGQGKLYGAAVSCTVEHQRHPA